MAKELTLEEIDAKLDEEFKNEDGTFKENVEVVEDEIITSPDLVQLEETKEVIEETKEIIEEKTPEELEAEAKAAALLEEEKNDNFEELEEDPKVDKQAFKFEEMRKKNRELAKDNEDAQALRDKFAKMAADLGYSDVDEFLASYKDQTMVKEAEEANVDPEFYKKHKAMEAQLEKTKENQTKQEFEVKVNKFAGELDGLIKSEGLTEANKDTIIKELEKDGYTIDELVTIKNPNRFLRGYAVEMLAEKKVQAKLKNDSTKVFEDEKHSNAADITSDDIDKQIAKEMAAYAKANNLS